MCWLNATTHAQTHTHTAGRDHEGSPSLFNHHEKKKKKRCGYSSKGRSFSSETKPAAVFIFSSVSLGRLAWFCGEGLWNNLWVTWRFGTNLQRRDEVLPESVCHVARANLNVFSHSLLPFTPARLTLHCSRQGTHFSDRRVLNFHLLHMVGFAVCICLANTYWQQFLNK